MIEQILNDAYDKAEQALANIQGDNVDMCVGFERELVRKIVIAIATKDIETLLEKRKDDE